MVLQHPRIWPAVGHVPSSLGRTAILKVSSYTYDWKRVTIPPSQTPRGGTPLTVLPVGSMNSSQQVRMGVLVWQDTFRLRILAVVIDVIAMNDRKVDVNCMFGCRSTECQRLRRCLV